MSADDLEPHLSALLDVERETPGLSDARRASILARLEVELDGSPPDGGGTDPTGAPPRNARSSPVETSGKALAASKGIAKAVMLLAVGGAIGALAHARLTAPKPRGSSLPVASEVVPNVLSPGEPRVEVTRPVAAPSTSVVGGTSPIASHRGRREPPPPRLGHEADGGSNRDEPPAPEAPAPEAPAPEAPAPARPSALAEERALVERGRAALARRDGVSALQAFREHATKFPAGQFAEERDALVVQALVAAGYTDDARQKALRFEARYPRSIFLPRVKETIERTR